MARYIQVETAAENVLTYSRIFRAAIGDWGNFRVTVTDNNSVAPDGTNTADKITEDSSNNTHFVRQSITPDGSSPYTYSVYAKPNGRNWIRLNMSTNGFPSVNLWYDIENGIKGTNAGALEGWGIEYAANGWYRCWLMRTSNAAIAGNQDVFLGDTDNSPSYLGDGSSGVYLWNAQMEIGAYPSSPIETTNLPVTRPKDQASWVSADVPDALRGTFSIKVIPYWDNTDSDGGTIYDFAASGASDRIRVDYDDTSDKIRIRDMTGAANLVLSNALTFSRGQVLTITLNPAAGSITVSGATSGDGTVVGTPWATTEGIVYLGQNIGAATQFNGLISEPFNLSNP